MRTVYEMIQQLSKYPTNDDLQVGKHFQGNPYRLDRDMLIRHGAEIVDCIPSFDGIRDYLKQNKVEGLAFWKDGEPQCKIKRSDFGFEWPIK